MDFHPVANIFPLLQEEEFEELKRDIAQNGLRQSIWLHPDGRIVDGRNRWRACVETSTNARMEIWDEARDGSLINFVVSLNLKRRHLTSSQRAAIAIEVLPMLEEEARERQHRAGELYGENHPKELSQRIDEPLNNGGNNGRAAQQAAQIFHTNRQYVSDAKRLADNAPDLLHQVKAGDLTIIQARRELQKRTKPDPLPLTGKYRVIYADPPWKYGNTMPDYFTEQADHYGPMALAEIVATIGFLTIEPDKAY